MTDYTRKGQIITPDPSTDKEGSHKDFGSINKAKKESRSLQSSGHAVKRG